MIKATRVLPGIPGWAATLCQRAFKNELRASLPKSKMRGIYVHPRDVEDFLVTSMDVHPRCRIGFTDHLGQTKDGEMVSEPYAATCDECRIDARLFALKIGCDFKMSTLTFHAPEKKECVRFTFSDRRRRP